MFPRITLDKNSEEMLEFSASRVGSETAPGPSRHLAHANWEVRDSDTLTLYFSGEPRIGEEFSYNDLRWRVIDYRDGWVAEMLVRER
jgi:hypothetical protein